MSSYNNISVLVSINYYDDVNFASKFDFIKCISKFMDNKFILAFKYIQAVILV